MPLGDYVKTTFIEGSAPGISAARLNNHENKTAELDVEAKSKNTQLLEATGYGVISGLTVTAQTTPDMTVSVATGTVHMANGVRFTPAANSALAVTAADATNPRIDIVYVSSAGIISYLAGTPAASPAAPATPTDGFLLAQISVGAAVTTITNADITDKRKLKNTTDSVESELNTHLADYTLQIPYAVDTSTTAGVITVTLNPAPTAYVVGMAVTVKVANAVSGTTTININGLGAKSVKKPNGTDPNFTAGGVYTLRYDGTNFTLQGSGGGGTATADKVLTGYTFTNDTAENIAGTMPNKVGSGTVITPGTADIAIPQGYFGGALTDGKVIGSVNHIASNIRAGVTDFGVVGTLSSVSNVQRGITSMAAGVNSVAVTISTVDLTKSMVIINSYTTALGSYTYNYNYQVKAVLTDSTTLTLSRTTDGGNAIEIAWQVIQFDNVKSLQTGSVSLTATPTTVTITAINPAKSILIISENSTDNSFAVAYNGEASITDSTTLTFKAYGASTSYPHTFYWRVIEFN